MSDESDTPSSGIPEWQKTAEDSSVEDQLTVARRFLEDDDVKTQPRDKKVAFLKAKGIEDGDIEKLLDETPSTQLSEQVSNAIIRLIVPS